MFARCQQYNADDFSDEPDFNTVCSSLTLQTKTYSLAEVWTLWVLSSSLCYTAVAPWGRNIRNPFRLFDKSDLKCDAEVQ